MARNPNTMGSGSSFDQSTISAVWHKGQVVSGYDPAEVRKDMCGAWMKRSEYGTTGQYGWEIDHIQPVARGGGDSLSNLQPLLWKNNRAKGDNAPNNWMCAVRA